MVEFLWGPVLTVLTTQALRHRAGPMAERQETAAVLASRTDPAGYVLDDLQTVPEAPGVLQAGAAPQYAAITWLGLRLRWSRREPSELYRAAVQCSRVLLRRTIRLTQHPPDRGSFTANV